MVAQLIHFLVHFLIIGHNQLKIRNERKVANVFRVAFIGPLVIKHFSLKISATIF